jgi:hypothetical protein
MNTQTPTASSPAQNIYEAGWKARAADAEARRNAAPQSATATPAHTPTPWHVDNCPSGFIYINAGSCRIARIEDQKYMTEEHAQADADFIVTAVNSHAALVARVAELEAALKQIAELRETADARGDFHLARGIARDALASVQS